MTFYNDNDPGACAWLRELMADGLITQGTIDNRGIEELNAADILGATRVHLFAGAGGWDRALSIANWPADVPVWTASCPCQPLSCAGKRGGEKDERHLWPELYRLINECRPDTIFGEQTAHGDGPEWVDGISLDLEELDYAVTTFDLPSASVGAPDIRQRIWWVAVSGRQRGTRWASAEPRGSVASKTRRPHAQPGRCGGVGGMAGRESIRLPGRADNVDCWRWQCAPGPIREDGRLELSDSPGLCARRETTEATGYGRAVDPAGRVAFWDDYELVLRRDPRGGDPAWCRTKRGIFPLAPRIPATVALLRGSGNAINPYVAASFVRAYMEIMGFVTNE